MTKALLIGSTSLVGKEIIKQSPHEIHSPSSKELDLCNIPQLDQFDLTSYDILILNAGNGMCDHEDLSKNSSDKILKIFQTNSVGNFILVKNYLASRKTGTLLYVGGRTTKLCKSSNIAYATSKLAVNKMFSSLRNTYKNFQFLIINPGKIKSRLNSTESNYSTYLEPSEVAKKIWYMIENKIIEMDYYE